MRLAITGHARQSAFAVHTWSGLLTDDTVDCLQEAGDEGFQEGYHDKVQAWIGGVRLRFAQAQETERAARQPVENAEGTHQVMQHACVGCPMMLCRHCSMGI